MATIKTDVLIIGAGPAGLASAIALKRKAAAKGIAKPEVLVLDKGKNIGSHVLSGAIIDPQGFKGLLTDEEIEKLPCETKVVKESFRTLLGRKHSIRVPWVPPMMSSKGFPVTSLTKVVKYLAEIARKEGVKVLPGYAITELIEESDRIAGGLTGEKGVGGDRKAKSNYLPREAIYAKHTILAEGGAGILTDKLIQSKQLHGERPQTYALAIKELIELPNGNGRKGEVMHTFGWPADLGTYGGGFVYHVSDTQVMVGYAYALDYRKAEADPFELFRQFKNSKCVKAHFEGGKTVAYGAKVIPEGGYFSVPKVEYPGVMIVGDGAGLLDSLRIKGVHIALESGMAAAEAILEKKSYAEELKKTTGWKEMKRVRNVRAGFAYGMPVGVMMAGLAWATRGLVPWGMLPGLDEGDRAMNQKQKDDAFNKVNRINGPVEGPDRITDVFMSGTIHEENQECHLKLKDRTRCVECKRLFGAPCTRFCPAEVYRMEDLMLRMDFSNCLHCKTCKIKCPEDNIEWTFPQGGDGPRYTRM